MLIDSSSCIVNNLFYFQIHCGNCKHPLGTWTPVSRWWTQVNLASEYSVTPWSLSQVSWAAVHIFFVLYTYIPLYWLSYLDKTISGDAWVLLNFRVDITRLWQWKANVIKPLTKSFLGNLKLKKHKLFILRRIYRIIYRFWAWFSWNA